eukprot:gene517-8030_t
MKTDIKSTNTKSENSTTEEEFFDFVVSGNVEKIKEYHQNGGNIHCADEMGLTALQTACLYGKSKLVEVLLFEMDFFKNSKDKFKINITSDAFGNACISGFVDIVKIFVEKLNVNPNSLEGFLRTDPPLVLAAENGRLDVVEYLLQIGAKVDIRNEKKFSYGKNSEAGPTSLMIACKTNNLEMVKLLLKNGANPIVFFNPNESLLQFVVRDKKKELEKILKQHGAKEEDTAKINVNLKNYESLDKLLSNGPTEHSYGTITKI